MKFDSFEFCYCFYSVVSAVVRKEKKNYFILVVMLVLELDDMLGH